MDKRLEETLGEQREELATLDDKIDLALEILVKMAEGEVGSIELRQDDIEGWKQRCRVRAADKKRRRR